MLAYKNCADEPLIPSIQMKESSIYKVVLVCIDGGLDFPCFEMRLNRELRRMQLRVLEICTSDGSRKYKMNKEHDRCSSSLYNADTIKSNNKKRIWTSWRGACFMCGNLDNERLNSVGVEGRSGLHLKK